MPQPAALTFADAVQDVSDGKPVQVADSDLWGMAINVAAAVEAIRNTGKADKGSNISSTIVRTHSTNW